MSTELWVPKPRDLPSGRFAARARHLRAEIARQPVGRFADRTRLVAAVAIMVALAAALLATPAFGLRDRIVNLFAAEQPEQQRPPEIIRRYFENMYDARPNESTGVVAGKARVAIRLAIPGFGHETLWVAPTRAGGFCSNVGCNRTRSRRFEVQVQIAGPTSTNSSPQPGSRNQHVFFLGDTSLPNARGIAIRFEDGSFERTPLVWVSRPIDAGFFLYLLPKSHWKPGKRPVAVVAEDAQGHRLAGDDRIGSWFRDVQRRGLAPPPKEFNRLWLLVPFATALLAAAALLTWRRLWC
jgi:hypothetical protein